MHLIRRVIEWFKARRRGEVRTHSPEVRGRVYKREARPLGEVVSEGKISVEARIFRANGNVEDLGVISRSD